MRHEGRFMFDVQVEELEQSEMLVAAVEAVESNTRGGVLGNSQHDD
jgi:hypothetical protein